MSRHSSRGAEWERVRQQVLDRDGHLCRLQYGGCTTVAVTVDHTHPKVHGGTDDPTNLVAACLTCNGKKQDRILVRQTWVNPRYELGSIR